MTSPTRPLGRSGLQLTTLGFGSTGLGNLHPLQTEDGAMATVQAAHDAGLRYFDTVPLHGFGLARRRIAGLVLLSTRPAGGWAAAMPGTHPAAPRTACSSTPQDRAALFGGTAVQFHGLRDPAGTA